MCYIIYLHKTTFRLFILCSVEKSKCIYSLRKEKKYSSLMNGYDSDLSVLRVYKNFL